jgi:protein-L-isoaspartate(D-aspartate) O-methyltransferase
MTSELTMPESFERVHHRLIDQLIARGALWSRPLIQAFRETPRHFFLARVFHHTRREGWREVGTRPPDRADLSLLYSDRALTTRLSSPGVQPPCPISSSTQPSLMAQMLEDLHLERGQRVLEIGTGTGYNAALLARVVGDITSLEVDRQVLNEAREHLARFPDRPVHFHHGDGRRGYPEGQPYDRLLITASTSALEPAWIEQLSEGGRLLAPMEVAPGLSYLIQGAGHRDHFTGRLTRPAYFMPLRAEGESGRENPDPCWLPDPGQLQAIAAPWSSWAERRPFSGTIGFVQGLVFLGWLQGLTVSCRQSDNGETTYGVGDLTQGHICWLGTSEWRVSGPLGRNLGNHLWQTFLSAGGPRPTEFRLRAYPPGASPERKATRSRCRLRFARQGTRCYQLWDLGEPRRRPEWA